MTTCLFTPYRLAFKGMSVSRPNAVIGKCRMIRHSRDKKNEPNPQRCVLCFILSPVCVFPSFPFQVGQAVGMKLWNGLHALRVQSTGQDWSRKGEEGPKSTNA